jgi:putative Ca2+/H+ antiporter (TMEM165/GDT1 family)
MDLAVLLTVFGLIFVGELPDKTALAALVMGSRYRASWVFSGIAAAFLMHVVIAVALGQLLSLAPRRIVEFVVGFLFLVGAFLLLRESRESEDLHRDDAEAERAAAKLADRPPTFRRVAGTAFGVIAVAEFGDLTQILTANLAAKYHDPLTVGVGAVLALWAVGGLAIVGGKGLLKVIPLSLITKLAALVMAGLAAYSVVAGIRG